MMEDKTEIRKLREAYNVSFNNLVKDYNKSMKEFEELNKRMALLSQKINDMLNFMEKCIV